MTTITPTRHHIDRRARGLIEAAGGEPDQLLTTPAWLSVSTQYRRGDVISWLAERTYARTSQYGEG